MQYIALQKWSEKKKTFIWRDPSFLSYPLVTIPYLQGKDTRRDLCCSPPFSAFCSEALRHVENPVPSHCFQNYCVCPLLGFLSSAAMLTIIWIKTTLNTAHSGTWFAPVEPTEEEENLCSDGDAGKVGWRSMKRPNKFLFLPTTEIQAENYVFKWQQDPAFEMMVQPITAITENQSELPRTGRVVLVKVTR